jgi:hypothetical protein
MRRVDGDSTCSKVAGSEERKQGTSENNNKNKNKNNIF